MKIKYVGKTANYEIFISKELSYTWKPGEVADIKNEECGKALLFRDYPVCEERNPDFQTVDDAIVASVKEATVWNESTYAALRVVNDFLHS